MDLIKMSKKKEIKIKTHKSREPDLWGEDGAKTVFSKHDGGLENRPRKKRKPVMPNRDGVDMIRVVSQSEKQIEVECRFLFKDRKPKEKIRINIPLPNRKNVESLIKQLNPEMEESKTEVAVNKWLQDYVKKKIRNHRGRNQTPQEKLFVHNIIGDVEYNG